MFVYIVWTKTKYLIPKRSRRFRHLEHKKTLVPQTKHQQKTLLQLQARKWDSECNDYVIYRVNVDDTSKLASIESACEACGLLALTGEYAGKPVYKNAQIAWQGMGGGPEKLVNAAIARKEASEYLQAKLDLLAQIRIAAGFDSQFEAYNIPGIPEEMKEKWTALLTPEVERWKEYLAWKETNEQYKLPFETISQLGLRLVETGSRIMRKKVNRSAYHAMTGILSTKEAKEAFVGESFPVVLDEINERKKQARENGAREFGGRAMMQCEVESYRQAIDDTRKEIRTYTTLEAFKESYLANERSKRRNRKTRSPEFDCLQIGSFARWIRKLGL
jgi:hypothetical protein